MNKYTEREMLITVIKSTENIYRFERESYQEVLELFKDTFGEDYYVFVSKLLGKKEYKKFIKQRKKYEK